MDTKMAPTEPGWIQNHWAYQKAIADVLALPRWELAEYANGYCEMRQATPPFGEYFRVSDIEALRGEGKDGNTDGEV